MEHVKAKKITVKLLKIKGHTFRNTTYSKATPHHAISIIMMESKIAEAD